jgi:Flp pilus assembly protein TadD
MKKLLTILESYYEPEKITAIIQGITVDDSIKRAVEDEEFLSRYWETNQHSDAVWTAANIAGFAAMFYSENSDLDPETFVHQDLFAAGKDAMHLQTIINSAKTAEEGLKTFLATEKGQNQQLINKTLVYTYGFQSEKQNYLKGLFNVLPVDTSASLVVKAIIQNARSANEIKEPLQSFISSINIKSVSKVLTAFDGMAYHHMAEVLANDWLTQHQAEVDVVENSSSIDELFALMEIYSLAGKPDSSANVLSKVKSLIQMRSEQMRFLQFSAGNKESEKSAKSVSKKENLPDSYIVDYALSSEEFSMDDMEEFLPTVNDNPLVMIRLAGLLQSEKPEQAYQMAANAIRQLMQQGMNIRSYLPSIKTDWKAASIIRSLNQLNLSDEAVKLGKVIQEVRPNDHDVLQELIWANQKLQRWDQAETQAKTLYFENPVDKTGLATLAEIYESSESWKNAYDAWKQYMALSDGLDVEITQHFMKSAIHSGFAEEALKYSDDPILTKQNHAGISYYRGLANEKIGKVDNAEKMYLQGTRQDASFGKNWLALANLYVQQNKTDKSVEILKTAAVHAPNDVEILLNLARLYITNEDIETARKIMRQAVEHNAEKFEAAEQMLENLAQLDENAMLYDFASKVQSQWPSNAKIAYHLANACNKLGKKNEALRAYEVAVQSENPRADWIFDYASALVNDGEEVFEIAKSIPVANYVKALALVSKVDDEDDSWSFKAKLLQGELLIALGKNDEAFDHYKSISNELDGINPDDALRFQIGFGSSAYRAGKNEIAVAALKEAANDTDKAVFVNQQLAEAYKALGFTSEAMVSAKSALSSGPTLLANLSWFADFAISLDATEDAKEALEVATELAPDDLEYWIAYAVILSKIEDWDGFDQVMHRIKQFPNIEPSQIQTISDLYLQINEPTTALDILQDGFVQLGQENVSGQYLLSMALLAYRNGKIIEAAQHVQQLLEKRDYDAGLHTFFGDLLAEQKKYHAAVASFEHGIKLLEVEEQNETIFDNLTAGIKTMVSQDWINDLYNVSSINLRMGAIDVKEAKNEQAIKKFSTGINEFASLSNGSIFQLLNGIYAVQDENLLDNSNQILSFVCENETNNISLGGLAAEMALDKSDFVQAGQLLHAQSKKNVENDLVSVIQGRLLLQNGDWDRAEEIFIPMYQKLSSERSADLEQKTMFANGILAVDIETIVQMSMVKFAAALKKWQEAAKLQTLLEKKCNDAPVVALTWIESDLLGVENKHLGDELEIKAHLPKESTDGESAYSHSMSMLKSQRGLISSDLADRIEKRIQLVYRPSLQTIREMVQLVPNEKDVHFLVPAVRRLNHCEGVKQLAQKGSHDIDVQMNVSLCALNEQPEKAMKEIDSAITNKPNDPIFLAVKSICLEKLGNIPSAYQTIEKALSIWPDEAMWHIRAAKLSKQISQIGKSKKHFSMAHEIAPANDVITNHFVASLIDEKQYQEAFDIIDKAKHDNPSDMQWNLLLADLFEKNDQLDDAELELSEAISKGNGASLPKLKMANILLKRNSFEKALDITNEITETPENIEEILFLKAASYHGLGKSEKAIQLLENYLNKNHVNNEKLALERTRIVRALQGDRTAMAYAEELVNHFPDCAEGYALLADMHFQCKDFEDAGKFLEKGLNLNANDAQMNYLNGLLAIDRGNLDLAVHSFAKTIEEDENFVDAYRSLCDAHLRRREFAEATNAMLKGVEQNPQDVELILDTVKILKDNKDYGEAEKMLRKAAEIKPEDVNIQRQLGAIIALNLVHNQ